MALSAMTTTLARADEIPQNVITVADEAGVDPLELLGAVNTTHMQPEAYLCLADGIMCPPRAPVVAAAAASPRVACIEAKESGGANIANRQGSGAGGTLQYMESTFRAHAAEMARETGDLSINSWSRWIPSQARALAAWDLSKGRRSQWTVAGC